MFERFRGIAHPEGEEPEEKNKKGETVEAVPQSPGQEVVDAAIILTKKKSSIAKIVRRSRVEDASSIPDISTRWKTVALGLALAFGLNAFAPKVMAGEHRTDEPGGGDESGQTELSFDQIVHRAQENIASHDLAVMKMATRLFTELAQEPLYVKTYPATGNAFYPNPYDAKDYISGDSADAHAKQKTMKDLDKDRLYEKAKLIAQETVEKNLGADALDDEDVSDAAEDLADAYSKRDITAIEKLFAKFYGKMAKDVSRFELQGEDGEADRSADAGPLPDNGIHIPEGNHTKDIIAAMVTFHGAMLASVIQIGGRYSELLKNKSSSLDVAKEMINSQRLIDTVAQNYLQNLDAEQLLLVSWDQKTKDAIENPDPQELFGIDTDVIKLAHPRDVLAKTMSGREMSQKVAEATTPKRVHLSVGKLRLGDFTPEDAAPDRPKLSVGKLRLGDFTPEDAAPDRPKLSAGKLRVGDIFTRDKISESVEYPAGKFSDPKIEQAIAAADMAKHAGEPIMERFNRFEKMLKSRMAKGHEKTFYEEIQPGKYVELFNKMKLALVEGDRRLLEETLDEAKLLELRQKETCDYLLTGGPLGSFFVEDDFAARVIDRDPRVSVNLNPTVEELKIQRERAEEDSDGDGASTSPIKF